jgi:hypothetical protein
VDRELLEEEHFAWADFERLAITHEEGRTTRQDDQILIAGRMIMGRRRLVDAEHAGAGLVLVGQPLIDQQRISGFGEGLDDRVEVEGCVRGCLNELLAFGILAHGISPVGARLTIGAGQGTYGSDQTMGIGCMLSRFEKRSNR